jgi:hypothetical protein
MFQKVNAIANATRCAMMNGGQDPFPDYLMCSLTGQMMNAYYAASGSAPGPSGQAGAGDLDASKLLGSGSVPPAMPADEVQ